MENLKERKKEGVIETPKISITLAIIRQSEDFKDLLSRVIGARSFPLFYVTREDTMPSGGILLLTLNELHLDEFSSVEDGLIAHASCDNPLLKDISAKVLLS